MQLSGGRPQFANFSGGKYPPLKSWRSCQQAAHRRQRRGARFVRIVDQRKSIREPDQFAAHRGRSQIRQHAPRLFRANAPFTRRRNRRQRVPHHVPPRQRHLQPHPLALVYQRERRTQCSPVFDLFRSKFRRSFHSVKNHPTRSHLGHRGNTQVIRIQHRQRIWAIPPFHQSAFRQRELLHRRQIHQVPSPPARPNCQIPPPN